MRSEQFERACLWFLTHEPAYARKLKRVWLWRDWPDKWGVDAGIDIVADDGNGKLWAIQARAYEAVYTITRSDIAGFLAASGRSLFSCRLVMATTNRLSATAQSALDAQKTPSSVLLLDDLESAEVEWPDSPSEL